MPDFAAVQELDRFALNRRRRFAGAEHSDWAGAPRCRALRTNAREKGPPKREAAFSVPLRNSFRLRAAVADLAALI